LLHNGTVELLFGGSIQKVDFNFRMAIKRIFLGNPLIPLNGENIAFVHLRFVGKENQMDLPLHGEQIAGSFICPNFDGKQFTGDIFQITFVLKRTREP